MRHWMTIQWNRARFYFLSYMELIFSIRAIWKCWSEALSQKYGTQFHDEYTPAFSPFTARLSLGSSFVFLTIFVKVGKKPPGKTGILYRPSSWGKLLPVIWSVYDFRKSVQPLRVPVTLYQSSITNSSFHNQTVCPWTSAVLPASTESGKKKQKKSCIPTKSNQDKVSLCPSVYPTSHIYDYQNAYIYATFR